MKDVGPSQRFRHPPGPWLASRTLAREVLICVPHARTFVIYDLRNGGDPTRPHGVVEVELRKVNPLATVVRRLNTLTGARPWRCSVH
jgi:hypothetical protein